MQGPQPLEIFIQFVPLILLLVIILPAWAAIFHKAGYSGWLGLLFIIPLVNLGIFLWFAFFAKWPVQVKAQQAEAAKTFS